MSVMQARTHAKPIKRQKPTRNLAICCNKLLLALTVSDRMTGNNKLSSDFVHASKRVGLT